MNKKFLQSVAAGVMGLSLVASCSYLGAKKESNICGAKNGCAAKKDEANKCSAKKDEAHKCAAKHNKKAKKTKAVKTETKKAVKTETKTEEKTN
jgi:hypothetical protein